MKKFLVLYMADRTSFEKMMREATPEMQKKGMDAWMGWMQKHQAQLVDSGAPLGKSKRVTGAGAMDVSNELGGYSIVQAESLDAAAKMYSPDFPHLQMQKAWVEIVEIMPIPGM